jgi:hypothetical protein
VRDKALCPTVRPVTFAGALDDLVSALAGIVAGGVLGGGAQVYRDHRANLVRARSGARLIIEEFVQANRMIRTALDREDDPEWRVDEPVTAESWPEFRDAVVPHIDFAEWRAAQTAFNGLVYLNLWIKDETADGPAELTDAELRDELEGLSAGLEGGIAALARLSKDPLARRPVAAIRRWRYWLPPPD